MDNLLLVNNTLGKKGWYYMEIKVRVFFDGKQVEPSELTIKNPKIDRIVNDIVERCNDSKNTDVLQNVS